MLLIGTLLSGIVHHTSLKKITMYLPQVTSELSSMPTTPDSGFTSFHLSEPLATSSPAKGGFVKHALRYLALQQTTTLIKNVNVRFNV